MVPKAATTPITHLSWGQGFEAQYPPVVPHSSLMLPDQEEESDHPFPHPTQRRCLCKDPVPWGFPGLTLSAFPCSCVEASLLVSVVNQIINIIRRSQKDKVHTATSYRINVIQARRRHQIMLLAAAA